MAQSNPLRILAAPVVEDESVLGMADSRNNLGLALDKLRERLGLGMTQSGDFFPQNGVVRKY